MASGFNFKLEKILDIRKQNEQKSATNFNLVKSEALLTQEKLSSLQDEFQKHNSINSNETASYQKIKRIYMQNVTKAIELTKKELVRKEVIVDEKRQELLLKQIDRKTVEKIKEKKYEEFRKEISKKESAANDEFAIFGHFRRLERR